MSAAVMSFILLLRQVFLLLLCVENLNWTALHLKVPFFHILAFAEKARLHSLRVFV